MPVRFVQPCVNGHISDIDWYRFVHENSQTKCRGQLWLDEGGAGNDFADIFVRCEGCEARRPLANATIPNGKVLGQCAGDRPWLGPKAQKLYIQVITGITVRPNPSANPNELGSKLPSSCFTNGDAIGNLHLQGSDGTESAMPTQVAL